MSRAHELAAIVRKRLPSYCACVWDQTGTPNPKSDACPMHGSKPNPGEPELAELELLAARADADRDALKRIASAHAPAEHLQSIARAALEEWQPAPSEFVAPEGARGGE